MSRHLTLSKALLAVLLFIGIALGQNAFAQTSWSVNPSIEGNVTTFEIKHVGTHSSPMTVKYRTVNLSAYEGQHYHVIEVNGQSSNASSGDLTFPSGHRHHQDC